MFIRFNGFIHCGELHSRRFGNFKFFQVLNVVLWHHLARSSFTSSGNTASATFIRFNTISTKSIRDVNHTKIVKPKPAEDSAKHRR